MSKFIVTIETQGTSFYEPEGADIYLVLSGAFEGSLVTVEAAEQSVQTDAPTACAHKNTIPNLPGFVNCLDCGYTVRR